MSTSKPLNVLAFAGSLRQASLNKQLVKVAAQAAEQAGATVTVVDLADYPLPIFNEDIEAQGVPEQATALKKLFIEADAFLIASPEYNGSLTAALKNTLDWVSRPAEGEPMLAAFAGKTAAIMAASPGALGGLRGLVHLRAILSGIQVMVLPAQHALGQAYQAFDEAGQLKDEKAAQRVAVIAQQLVSVASCLKK